MPPKWNSSSGSVPSSDSSSSSSEAVSSHRPDTRDVAEIVEDSYDDLNEVQVVEDSYDDLNEVQVVESPFEASTTPAEARTFIKHEEYDEDDLDDDDDDDDDDEVQVLSREEVMAEGTWRFLDDDDEEEEEILFSDGSEHDDILDSSYDIMTPTISNRRNRSSTHRRNERSLCHDNKFHRSVWYLLFFVCLYMVMIVSFVGWDMKGQGTGMWMSFGNASHFFDSWFTHRSEGRCQRRRRNRRRWKKIVRSFWKFQYKLESLFFQPNKEFKKNKLVPEDTETVNSMFPRIQVTGSWKKDHKTIQDAVHQLQDTISSLMRQKNMNDANGNDSEKTIEQDEFTYKKVVTNQDMEEAMKEVADRIVMATEGDDGEKKIRSLESLEQLHQLYSSMTMQVEELLVEVQKMDDLLVLEGHTHNMDDMDKVNDDTYSNVIIDDIGSVKFVSYATEKENMTRNNTLIEDITTRTQNSESDENYEIIVTQHARDNEPDPSEMHYDELMYLSEVDDTQYSVTSEENGGNEGEALSDEIMVDPAKDSSDEGDGSRLQNKVEPNMPDLDHIPRLFVVDLWANDPDVVLDAIRELVFLLRESNEHRIQSIHAIQEEIGGCATLIGAMRKWYDNEYIQASGLEFLRMALSSEWSVFQPIARNADIIHLTLAAMANFPQNEILQEAGCGVLNTLSRTSINYTQRLVTTELEVIRATIEAMKLFPWNSTLQNYACKTLYKLSRWDVLRKPIKKAGGIKVLKKALKISGKEDEDTKKWVHYTLRRLGNK